VGGIGLFLAANREDQVTIRWIAVACVLARGYSDSLRADNDGPRDQGPSDQGPSM